MLISEAARLTGLTPKMIRHYEDLGLVNSVRAPNGYRIYQAQDLDTLHFIVRAKELGFNLADIQQLTSLWRNQQRPSSEVKQLAQAHIQDLESRAALLLDMAAKLRVLAEQCQGDQHPDCPILDGLEGGCCHPSTPDKTAVPPRSNHASAAGPL
ncbi:MerR family transcriptional regulator [Alcaligenes sp. Lyrl_28]|uniref:MerR family transcriptional regulator n=1 Tax=Alcaligenes sp. Lyrl_28 TaxID=3110924 RepID=UPI003F7BF27D